MSLWQEGEDNDNVYLFNMEQIDLGINFKIKYDDYLSLYDKSNYNFAIQYADEFRKSEDVLGIGDLYELSFGLIKDYQSDLQKGEITFQKQIEYLQLALPDININKQYLDEITRTASYMLEEIIKIIETESELLVPDIIEDNGIDFDGFNHLGVFLQIKALSNNDITKYEAVRAQKYETAFLYLYAAKLENDYKKLVERQQRQKLNK